MAGYGIFPKGGSTTKNPKNKKDDKQIQQAISRRLQKMNKDKNMKEDPNKKRVEKNKSVGY